MNNFSGKCFLLNQKHLRSREASHTLSSFQIASLQSEHEEQEQKICQYEEELVQAREELLALQEESRRLQETVQAAQEQLTPLQESVRDSFAQVSQVKNALFFSAQTTKTQFLQLVSEYLFGVVLLFAFSEIGDMRVTM